MIRRNFGAMSAKKIAAFAALMIVSLAPGLANAYGSDAYSSYSYNSQSFRDRGQMSIGGLYGSGIGASATYNLTRIYTLDAGISHELSGNKNTAAWGDILYQKANLFRLSNYSFNAYGGGGIKFRTENDLNVSALYYVGPRAVGGITHDFNSMPVEVFGELSLTEYLTQATKTEFGFNLGARYYF